MSMLQVYKPGLIRWNSETNNGNQMEHTAAVHTAADQGESEWHADLQFCHSSKALHSKLARLLKRCKGDWGGGGGDSLVPAPPVATPACCPAFFSTNTFLPPPPSCGPVCLDFLVQGSCEGVTAPPIAYRHMSSVDVCTLLLQRQA